MRASQLVAAGVLAAAAAVAWPARASEAAVPADPIGRYNLACTRALAGDREGAFAMLDQAIAAGFGAVETLEKDPDLNSLRGDARWSGVVARARTKANPCKTRPEARQLDFWVGEWDDCVVLENWTGALGGSGKSMNFWDEPKRRWQQTWIDDRGGVQQYTGHLVDGSLKYEGEGRRLTFSPLPGGRVRQLSEVTADGGKTWTVGYDFTYSRRK